MDVQMTCDVSSGLARWREEGWRERDYFQPGENKGGFSSLATVRNGQRRKPNRKVGRAAMPGCAGRAQRALHQGAGLRGWAGTGPAWEGTPFSKLHTGATGASRGLGGGRFRQRARHKQWHWGQGLTCTTCNGPHFVLHALGKFSNLIFTMRRIVIPILQMRKLSAKGQSNVSEVTGHTRQQGFELRSDSRILISLHHAGSHGWDSW